MNFIDYYEKEEVLWNTKLQAYKNRDARGEAVKRIVSAMNIEGLSFFIGYISFSNTMHMKPVISYLQYYNQKYNIF